MYFHTIDEALAKALMKQLVETDHQMCKGGIFHWDLNVENILVELNSAWTVPQVRIIDFGCGCCVESRYYTCSGTSCFKPPEVDSQRKYEAGPTTVWQLGLILRNLLIGAINFTLDKLHLKSHRQMEKVMELRVSNACEDFLFMCLDFDPL